MWEHELEPTEALLTEILGLTWVEEDDGWHRYAVEGRGSGTLAEVKIVDEDPRRSRRVGGTGAVHHAAWRMYNDGEQEELREFIARADTPGQPDRPLIAALDWGTQEGDRRYYQHLITPGEEVYVYGTVQQKPEDEHVWGGNVRNLLIQKLPAGATGEEPLFLISDKSEEELVGDRSLATVRIVAGAVAALLGVAGLVLGIGCAAGLELGLKLLAALLGGKESGRGCPVGTHEQHRVFPASADK